MEALISAILIASGFLILISSISIFLFLIPIRIRMSGNMREGNGSFHACTGWGLIDLCLLFTGYGWLGEVKLGGTLLFQRHMNQEKTGTEPSPEKEPGTPWYNLIRYAPLVRWIVPVLIHHTRISAITGNIRFGAGDPVATGLVYGYYQAILPLISGKTCSIGFIPDFYHQILEGEISVHILIIQPVGMIMRIITIILPEVIKDGFPKGRVFSQGVHA
jgi:hypothetical protein